MTRRASPASVLARACARLGLDSDGAEVLYDRSNTVYRLAGQPVVARLRYAPGSAAWLDRLAISVRVTRWLHDLDFPAVWPLEVEQPLAVDGYLVTFWHYQHAV